MLNRLVGDNREGLQLRMASINSKFIENGIAILLLIQDGGARDKEAKFGGKYGDELLAEGYTRKRWVRQQPPLGRG